MGFFIEHLTEFQCALGALTHALPAIHRRLKRIHMNAAFKDDAPWLPRMKSAASSSGDWGGKFTMTYSIDKSEKSAHGRTNLFHSIVLLAGIGAILAIASLIVWGPAGVAITVAVLGSLFALAPRLPPEAVMRLYRATAVPRDGSQLSSLVDVLAYRAELPHRPVLYVIPSMTLNAFAAGSPRHSAIAVTEGLLRRLSLREIAGVLAHEMSHIRNNDLWVMGLADLMTRVLQILSYVALGLAVYNVLASFTGDFPVSWSTVLLLYLAPAFSSLLQLGLSRTREFEADAEAARLTGDPEGLATALAAPRIRHRTFLGRPDVPRSRPARPVPVAAALASRNRRPR